MRTFACRLRRSTRVLLCALLCAVLFLSSVIPFVVSADPLTHGHSVSAKCRMQDGNTYKVTVIFPDETGIPSDARLVVREIDETHARYDEYMDRAHLALDAENRALPYTRFLDIALTDRNDASVEFEPAEGTSVDVRIRMSDADALQDKDVSVLHFVDDEPKPEVLEDVDVTDGDVSFATPGFSAYAIVAGPESLPTGWVRIASLDDLKAAATTYGVYMGHITGYYFTNSQANVNNTSRTGIVKTKPAENYPPDAAALYFFEYENNSNNQIRAYCYDDSGQKRYIKQSGNSLSLVDRNQASLFTVEPYGGSNGPDVFRVQGSGTFCWNMQGNASGKVFAAYNSTGDVNAKLGFWTRDSVSEDAYHLDGMTYGLMYYTGGFTGKAMMANETEDDTLQALPLAVLSERDDRTHQLFVPDDSEITMWTFESVESDEYYLKANANGSTKYLKISDGGLSLVSTPDRSCRVRVIPGSGTHAGQVCLKAGTNTLVYSGDVSTGFTVGGSAGSEWLNLVSPEELTQDFLMTYSARKVSVSDPAVTNGSRVILYTRVWNDEDKRYDFFAVDYDGTLVPCFEGGDYIKYVGNRINTPLWNFVEYYWEGTNDPNYYYELYNQYSEQFIAPQVTDGQILSDDTIGINLNGRRNGYYYSTILAWDDAYYAYAGLKVENGRVVSCPRNEADDFYFAILQDNPVDDALTLVDTVDNNMYGITMKLIDFTDKVGAVSNAPLGNEQDIVLGNNDGNANVPPKQGLLSTYLDEDDYPVATITGTSFSELYAGAEDANHLFIQSIYNASGYFEFDSTQNFASLNQATGDFKVYQELGTMDVSSRNSLKHGQFMPYNDLSAGVFASLNGKNLYYASTDPLPDTDPRKNEQMYLVRNPDYFFGLELEASFVQTPNGHDAWGHDIIYEFTGDDDFWLYVDGELVIDLGGIHSAMGGSVNFCTGEVVVYGRRTTLRDLFYNNYLNRDNHTAAEAQAYVDEIFQQNSRGQWVFKDYTTHTMRIFYMERGASASNLHMRFNLASVRPGTVLLHKELGNVENTESFHTEYPYQIWYKKAEDPNDYLLTEDDLNIKVYYKDTITPVTYRPTFTVDGLTYNSVFLLKPTETAEINLPDDAIEYRIVECGINTNVYSSVSVNGTEVEGTPINGNDHREDYGIPYETSKLRPRVTYRNTVDPAALRTLTIKKILYDETGLNELHNDASKFGLRLYFGNEYDDGLELANMGAYHVKDENGVYCSWDAANQCFAPLGPGKTDYTQLTAAEKASATFYTSMNGSITKIPPFYTVEVREVLAGTQYKVEERDYEIPDGYSLQKYVRYDDVTDSTTFVESVAPAQGVTEADLDPHVDVCNLKGWGLRINKRWSDADYMADRDPTYFAIYTGADEASLTLVPGTVRRMAYNESTLYWYFQTLPVNVPFNQYEIREVMLTNPVVGDDGVVTSYSSITKIAQGGALTIYGRQKGESQTSDFEYTVLYDKGTIDSNSNVRIDTATNNRPGIELRKTQWDGATPLANAQFTLKDNTDTLIGTFTSDANGLITVAFLRDNVDYLLTEIRTPQGYYVPDEPITIRLSNGTVTVTGIDSSYYDLQQGAGLTPTLTIKNHPYTFDVIKKDADTNARLAGVRFALHRQVTVNGVTTIDFNPMPGYENLVTDANGIIPRVNNTLAPGTYELREKAALAGYQELDGYIRFTVTKTGLITLDSAPDGITLTDTEQANGNESYVLSVPNTQRVKVSIWKTDRNGTTITTGATFVLYDAQEYSDVLQSPLANATVIVSGVTNANGILNLGTLQVGEYRLVETVAPDGYSLPMSAIRLTVSSSGVTAYQNGAEADVDQYGDPHFVAGQDENTWQIRVWNTQGTPLPYIGGEGTLCIYSCGISLLLIGTALLVYRVRRKRRLPA